MAFGLIAETQKPVGEMTNVCFNGKNVCIKDEETNMIKSPLERIFELEEKTKLLETKIEGLELVNQILLNRIVKLENK